MIPLGVLAQRQAAASSGLTLAYIGSTGSTTDATSYTFTSVPIGTPSADRHVIAVIMTRAGGLPTVNTCTIGGESTTLDVNYPGSVGAAQYNTAAIARVKITTGSTADVFIDWGVTAVPRCILFVYTITGAATLAVADTDTAASATSGATVSASLSNPAGGIVIAAHVQNAAPTWSSVTQDAGATYELAGAVASTDTAGALTITAKPPTGGSTLAAIAYEPA